MKRFSIEFSYTEEQTGMHLTVFKFGSHTYLHIFVGFLFYNIYFYNIYLKHHVSNFFFFGENKTNI